MKRLFTPAALGAALALSLAPVTSALAADITITPAMSPVANAVCGNSSDPSGQGDCANLNNDDNGNTVTVQSGATVQNNVFGRFDNSDLATTATGNQVTVSGTVTNRAYGAQAISQNDNLNATAKDNKVTVNAVGGVAGVVSGDTTGGYAVGLDGAAVSVTGNEVVVAGGTVSNVYGGKISVCGDDCTANASNNKITMTGNVGTTGGFYGGYAEISSGAITASGNTVAITGGNTSRFIYGGAAYTDNGGAATASGNTVTATGGTLAGNAGIEGADVIVVGDATASGNTVSITGGSVPGSMAIVGAYVWSDSGAATATNNTVEIGGTAVINSGQSSLCGGVPETNTGTVNSTGNTLKLSIKGVSVGDMGQFQNLNFQVPAGLGADAMLTVTDAAGNAGIADLGNNAKISVSLPAAPKVGDEFVLISAHSLIGTADPVVASPQGYTLAIDAAELANNRLVVKVTGLAPVALPSSATSVPALGESGLAALGLLLGGLGLVAVRRKA